MEKITHRTIVTYKWICTDKDRCEEIDEALDELVMHATGLSGYVASNKITGLECVTLDAKFKWAIKDLRAERGKLWRRVKKETQEEIVERDNVPMAEEVRPCQ